MFKSDVSKSMKLFESRISNFILGVFGDVLNVPSVEDRVI